MLAKFKPSIDFMRSHDHEKFSHLEFVLVQLTQSAAGNFLKFIYKEKPNTQTEADLVRLQVIAYHCSATLCWLIVLTQ